MIKKLTFSIILLGSILVSNMANAVPVARPKPPVTRAPEITMNTAGSAIALIAGILLLAGESLRTKRKQH